MCRLSGFPLSTCGLFDNWDFRQKSTVLTAARLCGVRFTQCVATKKQVKPECGQNLTSSQNFELFGMLGFPQKICKKSNEELHLPEGTPNSVTNGPLIQIALPPQPLRNVRQAGGEMCLVFFVFCCFMFFQITPWYSRKLSSLTFILITSDPMWHKDS